VFFARSAPIWLPSPTPTGSSLACRVPALGVAEVGRRWASIRILHAPSVAVMVAEIRDRPVAWVGYPDTALTPVWVAEVRVHLVRHRNPSSHSNDFQQYHVAQPAAFDPPSGLPGAPGSRASSPGRRRPGPDRRTGGPARRRLRSFRSDQ
jgi:hypothetical protein